MPDLSVPDRPHVVVVGGGISGLAAAHALAVEHGARVTLIEGSPRLGGRIETSDVGGWPVDSGPDAFLARVPHAVDLCRSLGLGDELVAPNRGQAFLWTRGRLRPLPAGLLLGVPAALGPLARSGVLSSAGLARAALDVALPPTRWEGDISVGDLVTARFGREVHERLVDPLVGGIHAGRSEQLSLAAVTPQLAAAAGRSRSLLLGLRHDLRHRQPAGSAPELPVFLTLPGGLSRLVDRLDSVLRHAGVDVQLGTSVSRLERSPGGWRVTTTDARGGGTTVEADAVILTTPAPVTARVLRDVAPGAAGELDAIAHAGVVLVTAVYPQEALARPLEGSGFLVPRVDGQLLTACTWSSSKWAHLQRPGEVVLRFSAGRSGDERALGLDDADLVARLQREAAPAIGLGDPARRPRHVRVTRWPSSFPQYAVGHLGRVDRIERALADLPGLAVAGAALRGVGIPACIASARSAAARAVEAVRAVDAEGLTRPSASR